MTESNWSRTVIQSLRWFVIFFMLLLGRVFGFQSFSYFLWNCYGIFSVLLFQVLRIFFSFGCWILHSVFCSCFHRWYIFQIVISHFFIFRDASCSLSLVKNFHQFLVCTLCCVVQSWVRICHWDCFWDCLCMLFPFCNCLSVLVVVNNFWLQRGYHIVWVLLWNF